MFRDLPIQKKLLRLVLLATAVALLVAAVALALFEVTTSRPRQLRDLEANAKLLEQILLPAVQFEDEQTASRYLDASETSPALRAAAVYLPDGRVFATYQRNRGDRLTSPGFSRQTTHVFGTRTIQISHPIVDAGNAIASLWLEVDRPRLSSRLSQYSLILAVALLSMLTLAVLLSFTLRRAISEPLGALAETARGISGDRDYTRRTNIASGDEVGQLAAAFNRMLEAVEERTDAVVRASARNDVIIRTVKDGLAVMDRTGRCVDANPALCEMLGISRDELCGKTPYEAGVVATPDQIPARLDDALVASGGRFETRMRRRDGQEVDIEAAAAAFDMGGPHLLFVMRDVTERKREEQARARLEEQVRMSQKMEALGTLAGGIAHDFNNILTAIGGNVEIAASELPANDPLHEYLDEVTAGTKRATDLVRRILAFARHQEGMRVALDVHAVVDEALRLLRPTLPTTIDIRTSFDPNLPKILGDSTQIHQVVMNLGTNARDAIGEHAGVLEIRTGLVTVDDERSRAVPQLRAGETYVCLSIEDTGAGMEPALMQRIFEPFFTTKPMGKGTGLGLSMVHGIMRGHQGAVQVSSEIDRGTRFDLYFPVAEAIGAAAGAAPPEERRGRGQRVAYLDDESAIVTIAVRMIRGLGYEVDGFTDPRMALAAVRANPRLYDAIITDMAMPGIAGTDVARLIGGVAPRVPVILASGRLDRETSDRAREAGIVQLLDKPFAKEDLARVLADVLDARAVAARGLSER